MTPSRWVVGLSALLVGACGGPAGPEQEVPTGETGAVEQRSEPPEGGESRFGHHRTYYSDPAMQHWAGAVHTDCQGYTTQSGQVTPYYTEFTFSCG